MIRFNQLMTVGILLVIAVRPYKVSDQKSEDDNAQAEIVLLEARNASATDATVLNGILADDYSMIGLDGSKLSKAEVVNADTQPSKPKVAIKIERVKYFQGSAVVIGSATISSQESGGTLKVEINYTNVWMKRGGSWHLVSSHVSPLHPVSAEVCLNQRANTNP